MSLIGGLINIRCLWRASTEEGDSVCNPEERLALEKHMCEQSAMEVLEPVE